MRRVFNAVCHWEQEESALCSLPASPGSGGDQHGLLGQAGGAAGPWLMQRALHILAGGDSKTIFMYIVLRITELNKRDSFHLTSPALLLSLRVFLFAT